LTIVESIFLGALQGVTEFLPISSSAHLIVVPWLMKIGDGGINKLTFDVLLHLGTLAAILGVYGKQFIRTVVEGLVDLKDGKFMGSLLAKMIFATLPAALFGVLGKSFIEQYLRTPHVAVFALIAVSVLMIVAERLPTNRKDISLSFALVVGFAQACALIPGASRSGITIAVAMLLGLKRKNAVDFSFLLSIPIILGTAVYEGRHLSYAGNEGMIYLAGVLSAFVFGFLSLRFLIRYLAAHSLDLFSLYRMGLATAILLLSF
jgi:undecaprenyl-diphosphatase